MTVNELIGVLRTNPGDLRVVVNGYEEGFDDLSPNQISLVRIALNTGVEDYEGTTRIRLGACYPRKSAGDHR